MNLEKFLQKLNQFAQKLNPFPSRAIRKQNVENIKEIANKALESLNKIPEFVKLSTEEKKVVKNSLFSEDINQQFSRAKKEGFDEHKSIKEMVFHFFGMNENWSIGRCLLGGFLVHSPEYPTYFIPAFTQATATGDAKELKKGEGPRGLITGAMEGIAVGALVSGGEMKLGREMVPYIIMGAGLQFFSSKVFPWLGEKAGRLVYDTRRNKIFKDFTNHEDIEKFNTKAVAKFKGNDAMTEKPKQDEMKAPAFSGIYKPFSTGMKI